jgi:hypothetical protein
MIVFLGSMVSLQLSDTAKQPRFVSTTEVVTSRQSVPQDDSPRTDCHGMLNVADTNTSILLRNVHFWFVFHAFIYQVSGFNDTKMTRGFHFWFV